MRLELALCKAAVGRLALGMADSLACQGCKIDGGTNTANGLSETYSASRHLSCVLVHGMGGTGKTVRALHFRKFSR